MIEDNFTVGPYNVTNFTSYVFRVCYMQNVSTKGESSWLAENPLVNYLHFIGMELGLVTFASHILIFILRPLFQTRVLAQILAGIIVGPSGIGILTHFTLPFEISGLVETFASLGLTYYMFMVGLEMDLSIVRHIDMKSIRISIFGILIPIGIGIGIYFLPMCENRPDTSPLGAAFWAISLTSTSFPDLARILSDVKLLHTNLGRMALNSAFISDICTWVLLGLLVTMINDPQYFLTVPLTTILLAIFWFGLRPCIARFISETKDKRIEFGETHIYLILSGVAICGLVTDACGSHPMIGGFMFGLIIPNGELGITIMERIEEFVTGILLPLFLVVSGLRTNLYLLIFKTNWGVVGLVAILGTIAKIASTSMVSLYLGMPARDGLALGGLMNTKGVLALIVINEGRNLQAMDNVTTAVFIFTVLLMTILVGPILYIANKNTRNSMQYKRRTIQRSNPDTELRVLTCIHSIGNLSSTIKLLEVSNASREQTISKQIIKAFEDFAVNYDVVYVQPLTVLSPYTTMHEDISNLAEEKRAAMILIPFQKQPIAGAMVHDHQHDPIRKMNLNLLVDVPCSVGLLVDRGLGSTARPSKLLFVMLFIGGPDDREALSYALRMIGSPAVILIVIRYLPSKDNDKSPDDLDAAKELELDDDYIDEFRFKSMCHESVTYLEKQVNHGAELIASLEAKYNHVDLYIVGRNHSKESPLMVGITDWNDCLELGALGEALVLSDFAKHSSILVVQQCSCSRKLAVIEALKHNSTFNQREWASPVLNPNYEAFLNYKHIDDFD